MYISTNSKFMFLEKQFYEMTILIKLTTGTVMSINVGNDLSNESICRTI
jgi:hypothetical protein